MRLKRFIPAVLLALAALAMFSPEAHAQLQQTPPPWAIQTKQGDFIVQNDTGNVNGDTFILTYRMILSTGERKEFQQSGLAGATGNGASYNSFPLPEGWLVGVSLTLLNNGTQSGQTYAQVFVGRNNSPVPNNLPVQLIGCNINSNYTCGWPGTWRSSTDGQGMNQSIPIANPAAGANLSYTFLQSNVIGQRHLLDNIRVTLTTNATAANRQVCIKLSDGTNVYFGSCAQGTQAASLVTNYDFSAGIGGVLGTAATLVAIPSGSTAGTANEITVPLPANLQIGASTSDVLTITILNIQTGDQIGNTVVRAQSWNEED